MEAFLQLLGGLRGISEVKTGEKRNRIAAKPRSERWSKFHKENNQKLTFGEGVQPWDLARCPWLIESYRFMLEFSKAKP